MRRIVLFLVFAALLSTSLSAQVASTPPATSSAPQALRDSQSIAVVQAGVTAMGGATAIGQIQSWTFQATMGWGNTSQGSKSVSYTLDTLPSNLTILTKSGVKRTAYIRSYFLPAVLAAVLEAHFQDTTYAMQYQGVKIVGSRSIAAVGMSHRPIPDFADEIWYFDTATGFPAAVHFQIPARLGSRISHVGTIEFSDYQSIGGVMYPFRIVTLERGTLPEVITIQSVTTSTTAPTPSTSGISVQPGDTL